MQRHMTITRIEASCHFRWALLRNYCDCESQPAWTAIPTRHWMQGVHPVCFANDAAAAQRVCLSCIGRSAWYFEKRKSLGLAKSLIQTSKTVIFNSTNEWVARAKGSTCGAVVPEPYHSLLLPVPSTYGPIPTPEITTLHNMVGALDFTNELFLWEISTGTLIRS